MNKVKKSKIKTVAVLITAFLVVGTFTQLINLDVIPTAGAYGTGDWELVQTLSDATDDIFDIAFSPDGKTMAVGDSAGYLRVYDVADWGINTSLNIGDDVLAVAYSNSGDYLAIGIGGANDSCAILNTNDWTTYYVIPSSDISGGDCDSVAWNNDDSIIACSSSTDDDSQWFPFDDWTRYGLGGPGSSRFESHTLAFSPNGTYLMMEQYDNDNCINIWMWNGIGFDDIGDINPPGTYATDYERPNDYAFSPDGEYFIFCLGDDEDMVCVYETHNWNAVMYMQLGWGDVYDCIFSNSGDYLAFSTISDPENVVITSFNEAGRIVQVFDNATENVGVVAFSHDDTYLVYGSNDDNIYVHKVNNGKHIDPLPGEHFPLERNDSCAYSVDLRIDSMNQVKLSTNASGDWVEFYSDETLGDVDTTEITGICSSWDEPYTDYWWRVSVYDGASWYNDTYNFTTMGVLGNYYHPIYFNDTQGIDRFQTIKNDTRDYLFVASTWDELFTMWSDNGYDWAGRSDLDRWGATREESLSTLLRIDNITYCYMYYNGHVDSHHRWRQWQGTTSGWTSGSDYNGFDNYYTSSYSDNNDYCYYGGVWNYFDGMGYWYTGTPPTTWSEQSRPGDRDGNDGHICSVQDGLMYLFYDDGGYFEYRTYNTVDWSGEYHSSKSYNIEILSDHQARVKNERYDITELFVTKGNVIFYGVLDNGPYINWSIFKAPCNDVAGVTGSYYDGRSVFNLVLDRAGVDRCYQLFIPDYTGDISGITTDTDRLQWAEASPNDAFVNSTVLAVKNIGTRDVHRMLWHFDDLGDIPANSNIQVWSNMSGSWDDIDIVDANGNTTIIDISANLAGGGEWTPGNFTYWKFAIVDVGSVAEDLHSTQKNIYYELYFTD